MRILDFLLLAFFISAAVHGYLRGLLTQLTSLLGWSLGFLLVIFSFRPLLEAYSLPIVLLLSFLLLFLGRVVAGMFLGALRPLVRLPILKQADRLLGLAFASLRALLGISFFLMVLHILPWEAGHEWLNNSPVAKEIGQGLNLLMHRLFTAAAP